MTVLVVLLVVLAGAALAVAITALREAHAARAQMASNVEGIHQAGMDAHRALGALKGLHVALDAPASTGRHAPSPVTAAAAPAPPATT